MTYEELLAALGEQCVGARLYSVEDRDMTNHETVIQYYLERDEAIRRAEEIWAGIGADDRDYREISVHFGEMEYAVQSGRYRFVVLQKLYKAYKKIYVCEAFAKQYRAQLTARYQAEGLDETAAKARAKQTFSADYAVQPAVQYGMFAGYDYAPAGVLEDAQ